MLHSIKLTGLNNPILFQDQYPVNDVHEIVADNEFITFYFSNGSSRIPHTDEYFQYLDDEHFIVTFVSLILR